MLFRRLLRFVKKDVKLFAADRQAVVMSLVVPILIASILGWLDSTASSDTISKPMPIDVVDLDHSDVTDSIKDRLAKGGTVVPSVVTEEKAKSDVRDGAVTFAVVFPKRFGPVASQSIVGGHKATLELFTDPSRPIEVQIAKGALLQQGAAALLGLSTDAEASPFKIEESHVAKSSGGNWAHAAHDYAGFGLQGLLFFAMEAAVGLARERRQGIWHRLRASPVPLSFILLSREVSSAIMSLAIIGAMFAFGALMFGIRVLGNPVGFGMVCVSTALMASTFGLLIATVGKTETQSRGISILLIMIMLATGGAWFPLAKMPDFVQKMADWLPVKWAVEGFDAMTWRGLGLGDAARFSSILVAFAGVFTCLAMIRFRWAGYHE